MLTLTVQDVECMGAVPLRDVDDIRAGDLVIWEHMRSGAFHMHLVLCDQPREGVKRHVQFVTFDSLRLTGDISLSPLTLSVTHLRYPDHEYASRFHHVRRRR